ASDTGNSPGIPSTSVLLAVAAWKRSRRCRAFSLPQPLAARTPHDSRAPLFPRHRLSWLPSTSTRRPARPGPPSRVLNTPPAPLPPVPSARTSQSLPDLAAIASPTAPLNTAATPAAFPPERQSPLPSYGIPRLSSIRLQ